MFAHLQRPTFRDERRLAFVNYRLLGALNEDIQRLLERLFRSVQVLLHRLVLVVTVRVDFVAPGAEQRGWEHLGDG